MAEEKYVNQAYLSVTESAANTMTFSKLETGVSIREKVGWLISRLDWFFAVTVADFSAAGAALKYGISAMDTFAALSLKHSGIIDMNEVTRQDWGVAASGYLRTVPETKSFADLPGGGLLVPPNPLYVFAEGFNLTNPQLVEVRLFYTVVGLKTEDFWELVEQRRMIGA